MEIADNQAVNSRFGEANWITDFITPDNPDVMLKYQSLTKGVSSLEDKIVACWRYAAHIPYVEVVGATLTVNGRKYGEKDTWLFPDEVIRLSPVANCANKSFVLTSLLRNVLPPDAVKCALGHITLDGIGAHAWVVVSTPDGYYLLETTIPTLERAFIPLEKASGYEPVIYFNDTSVFTVVVGNGILNEHFGFCAVPWLKQYLCERCGGLTGP